MMIKSHLIEFFHNFDFLHVQTIDQMADYLQNEAEILSFSKIYILCFHARGLL